MNTIKKGSQGPDVLFMQASLGGLKCDGNFGPKTEVALVEYQKKNFLSPDGVCGPKTWNSFKRLDSCNEYDINLLANKLGIEFAALMAVKEVESGKAPFTPEGRPLILFEGHIFYQLLKKKGLNPDKLGNPDIIYSKWTKLYYLGGDKEYTRLQRAFEIHPEAALMSASVGMFLVMGFNWTYCGAKDIYDYWANSWLSDLKQLEYLGNFIVNAGLIKYLKNLDFTGFARTYNGPGQVDYYANKLKTAYNKYK